MYNQTRSFSALKAVEDQEFSNAKFCAKLKGFRFSYVFLFMLLVLGAGMLAPIPVHAQVSVETQSIVAPCAIPFEVVRSRIAVSAVVNGQHGQLFFENGFSGLILNQDHFESGPKKESRMVFGKSTKVGNTSAQVVITCTDHIFNRSMVGDLSHMIKDGDNRVILGVIGNDIFAGGSVTFDMQNSDLLYSRSFAQVPEDSEHVLDLTFENDIPVVTAVFQNREIKVGLISSLSNCFISKQLLKRISAEGEAVLLGKEHTLTIADLPVNGIFIRGHNLEPFNQPGKKASLHGILGQEYFKHYQVTINYRNSHLRVQEYPKYQDIATAKK